MLHQTTQDSAGRMSPRTEATPIDYEFASIAIALSRSACLVGDEPFGAVVALKDGTVLGQAENRARRDGNRMHHAEVVAILNAVNAGNAAELKFATLYCSTEPCMMCCGMLHWFDIPRVVFCCSVPEFIRVRKGQWRPDSRQLLSQYNTEIAVVGPIPESEALPIQEEYWAGADKDK